MAEEIRKHTAYNDNDLTELRTMLLEESSKPFKKQDTNKLSELAAAISELEKEENAEAIQRCDEAIYSEIEKKKSKTFRIRRLKPVIAACCILAVIITANTISVSAWNMNIFSLIVQLTEGGAVIDFENQNEEIVLPTSEDDPYGIIAKCKENGITIETPHYIPNGFVLSEMECENTENIQSVGLVYKKGNQVISLSFDRYFEAPIGIPSDEHNLSEMDISGHTAIISKEDNQMIVVFRSGEFMFNMGTKNVDYSECDKILNSIK